MKPRDIFLLNRNSDFNGFALQREVLSVYNSFDPDAPSETNLTIAMALQVGYSYMMNKPLEVYIGKENPWEKIQALQEVDELFDDVRMAISYIGEKWEIHFGIEKKGRKSQKKDWHSFYAKVTDIVNAVSIGKNNYLTELEMMTAAVYYMGKLNAIFDINEVCHDKDVFISDEDAEMEKIQNNIQWLESYWYKSKTGENPPPNDEILDYCMKRQD